METQRAAWGMASVTAADAIAPVRELSQTGLMTVFAVTTASSAQSRGNRAQPGSEWFVIALLIVVQFALRAMALFNHQINSDEPQHLHVIWGWNQGLVQYRDVFDNHAPLFHLLMAPVMRLLGERADIILLGRILLLPLVALSLWATYRLGSLLWSPRTGAWAALGASVSPTWLLTSTEFRADILWMAAWLCALVALLGGPWSRRRGFVGGLLLGVALVTSLKTILLLAALGIGVTVVALARPRHRTAARVGEWARAFGWVAAGFVVLPVLIVVGFWWIGGLDAMRYCTLEHNIVPHLGHWGTESVRPWILPAVLLAMIPAARWLLGSDRTSPAQGRRVVLLLSTGCFIGFLESWWPLITREDYLPWIPMLALLVTAAVRGAWRWSRREKRSRIARQGVVWTLGLIVAFEMLSVFEVAPIWRSSSDPQVELLGDVLRLTRAHESIMDLKGETVFRPRPYYFALEGVTKCRLALGLLPDRIASDVRHARTHFATPDNPGFPPAAREFLNTHFVPDRSLRVLGADLGSDRRATSRHFDVSYSERFAILADGLPGRGRLDGATYRDARVLHSGPHVYHPAPGESHVILIWDRALHRSDIGAQITKGPA